MPGTPPFGYHFEDGELVSEADEQRVITRIFQLKETLSFGKIAAILNRDGELNRGKFWNPSTLWYIYNRELVKR